jgi:hypothetical protein
MGKPAYFNYNTAFMDRHICSISVFLCEGAAGVLAERDGNSGKCGRGDIALGRWFCGLIDWDEGGRCHVNWRRMFARKELIIMKSKAVGKTLGIGWIFFWGGEDKFCGE